MAFGKPAAPAAVFDGAGKGQSVPVPAALAALRTRRFIGLGMQAEESQTCNSRQDSQARAGKGRCRG